MNSLNTESLLPQVPQEDRAGRLLVEQVLVLGTHPSERKGGHEDKVNPVVNLSNEAGGQHLEH